MSVKQAAVTSATAVDRDSRRDIANSKKKPRRLKDHEGTRRTHCTKKVFFVRLRVLRVFVVSLLAARLQVDATERRHRQLQRLLEAVRREGLGVQAAEIADVAAA